MTATHYSPPLNKRRAGVLLHISSLPGPNSVGDLGENACRFVDFLQAVGASVWQTLPVNMPHADNSPYQCLSAFAGNTDFIDMTALVDDQLLSANDLQGAFSRAALLSQAYQAYLSLGGIAMRQAYAEFCQQQAYWLEDFSLFLALRHHFDNQAWHQWPEAYKNRDAATLNQARLMLANAIAEIAFAQFLFFSQWQKLKRYAASKHVCLFGDIPIFVAFDSADVWAKAHLFKLDAAKNMAVVAGVPPDYFSVTGQRWGNPHYDWQAMASDNYAWWIARMATQNALFDVVRIDHFRGLQAAWEIPVNEATAINGHWQLAPGVALLTAIKQALPNLCLVAEDLGIITDEVNRLRMHFQLPGMKILHFAFGGDSDNPYLPANIEENSVAYTGTHDNDTTLGWYEALDETQRQHLHACLGAQLGVAHQANMPMDLIRMAMHTKALLAVVPMQDVLGLDGQHRMNTPGTATGNWHWRFDWAQLSQAMQSEFALVVAESGRA